MGNATERDIHKGTAEVKYHLPVRILHAIIAFGIAIQLMLSLIMQPPEPGHVRSGLESFSFEVHEILGMVLLGALLLHWLLFLLGYAYRGIGHFFPWFSRARMRQVVSDLKEIGSLRFGDPARQDSLAGAVQGVGLTIASLLALTGGILYFGIAEDGNMSAAVHVVKEVHETLGPAMWAYLALHAGAVMAHTALGHGSVLSVFRLYHQRASDEVGKGQ